ncbi:unnamed protein product, partial [Tetraodon nigroviridis]
SLSLAWVGDASGVSLRPETGPAEWPDCFDAFALPSQVLLVLTTFQVPLFMVHLAQSSLYRSEDYGKTFQDVTHLINHTFIHTDFGIAISPDHSGKVMLTGDVSETGGFRLFRSRDFGLTFDPVDLPFEPLIQMLYNPAHCNIILTLSVTLDLWLSEDFGATWRKIHDSVCLVRWSHKNSIFFTTNHNRSCNDRGSLELRKTTDYGRTFQTIATRVYSFVLGGRFVFASIMTGTGTERMIHVSVDGGQVWNVAQLPSVNHEQFYSILAATQDMIFMHVDDPGDSGVGTIYVSDDRGAVFSKSLERHLYTMTGSETDFTAIASLRGVYMTSVLTEGSVGDTESVLHPDVYGSDDGGYSWLRALKGPHHYAILDSGGLLVAVEHTSAPVNQINGVRDLPPSVSLLPSSRFSTDEGQCWHTYNFTGDPFHFSSMDSEPGSRSMNVSLWGYRNDFTKWVVITVDFRRLFTKDCACLRVLKPTTHRGDFGYFRPENSSECVEQEEMKSRPLEFCLNGTTEQLQTGGYRKIPGDQCEGGFQPERKEVDLRRICISDFLHSDSLTETSPNTAVIVTVVMAILLMSAVMGVWLVKKYVCGGRFLVHRYSVMRENVEANKIEGVDDVDSHCTETGKAHYNEDSDQV